MKIWIHIVFLLVCICECLSLSAQIDPTLYGDEWINSDQSYFKFYTEEEGIYRISYQSLEAAGVPISTINGTAFSIYSFGQEIPIRTTTDQTFTSEDYIEFYATANDGSVDALLYRDPNNQQLNPFISLYDDRRSYYLTWSINEGVGASSLRFKEITNGLEANGLPPKETYYMHREVITYDEFHHKPSHDGRNFIRFSSMDDGEGYGSSLEQNRTIAMPVDKLSPFGVNPRVVIKFGTNVFSKNWLISTDDRNLRIASQSSYGVVDVDERFPLEELHEGLFNIHIGGLSGEKEKHSLSRIELHYPRRYEYDGEKEITFHQQASILSRYVEIDGFGGTNPILYNLTERQFLYPEQENAQLKFITKAAFQENKWMLVDQNEAIKEVAHLSEIEFKGPPAGIDYLIISHADLINSGSIQEYADYRASEEGGHYATKILDIEDLTERYGYGINGHPIAIKNMMRYLKDQNELPDYTFIIGKGREYTEIKEGKVTSALVPTFGIPGSDNLFLAFGDKRHPQKPIGRLAAQSPSDVLNYLEKVKTHEIRTDELQIKEDQAWKKRVIHLSGGSANNQAALFRFLGDMSDVISANTFGADVITFRKTTADPLQRATTDQIISSIDQGVALLTFFGHSAVGTFDFSLEEPAKYNNAGRNPIILSLGCHSGNIHTSVGGISEDFVLEKDKGAIAFIASSGTAYPEPQYFTGINFYDLFGGDLYGAPIGDILQKSLEERTDNPSVSVQTLIEQLTLHGDPAYRHNIFEGPDYSIDESSVAIEPSILNATTPQFSVSFDVINLGASIDEALDVKLVHVLPDGTPIDTQIVTIPAPGFNARVSVDLNNPGASWIGSNRIMITIDPDSAISESPNEAGELNNELVASDGQKGMPFFVFDNSAKPILPKNYGILNTPDFILRSAVNNGLNPGGQFILQIDTTQLFNSVLMTEEVIDNSTSIIDWAPQIEAISEVVYYWRIAPIDQEDPKKVLSWQTASFVYLPAGPSGWNQSHFEQLDDNDFYKMSLSSETKKLAYDDRLWDVRIKNEIRDEGDFWVYVNSTPWASLNPRGMGSLVSIFAWDRQDVLFKNSGSDFGSIPFTSDAFLYDLQDPEDLNNIVQLLDAIPDGARVFFHTMIDDESADLKVESWAQPTTSGPSIIDRLKQEGAHRIEEILEKGTVPYTFIYDKGVSAVIEDIANNVFETIDLTSKARSVWADGTITSIPIQAEDRWLRLMWSEEKEAEDETQLVVLGYRSAAKIDTLKKIVNDYDVNLTNIDPSKYETIQLVYLTEDKASKTAPQLNYWRVVTKSLPDAAFYATKSSFSVSDTLNAGEDLHLDFDLVNLTDIDMEPVLIRYTYIDQNYNEKVIVKRSQKLDARDTVNIIEQVSTDLLSGPNQLVIEVNPNEDQPELTACNNLGFTNFYVIPDKRNPFLDVTFDGRHIADREQVIATPEIVITLRDDGSFLLLDNPDDFRIKMINPRDSSWGYFVEREDVQWIPSTSLDDNRASFVITPEFEEEGIYILEVQAKDIAGNKAGELDYRISFEVSFSLDVPSLTVSPNPMTSFTKFSYYLEGEFIPEIFDLYIYTADGKLVKHATKEDFGGIKRGFNSYEWDGRSSYGNPLPMGLYFYEIVNSFDSRKDKRKGSILKLSE